MCKRDPDAHLHMPPHQHLNQEGVLVAACLWQRARGSDKIEDLVLHPLSAGFSFEHITAMSLRLKGPVCQAGASSVSPCHSISLKLIKRSPASITRVPASNKRQGTKGLVLLFFSACFFIPVLSK